MRGLLVGGVLLVAGTGGAVADECIVNGSTPIYAPDDSSISLIFDSFFAEPGNNGTCGLNIAAHSNVLNDPDLFEVYSATYKGFVDDGDTATITVEQAGSTDSAEVPGPIETTDTYFETYVGKNGTGNITTDTTLSLPSGFGTGIDTLDYNLAATMTRGDAEASLDEIGVDQVGLVTHLESSAGLLTGGGLSLEGDNEFGVFGGVGSFMAGANTRYNLGEGFSVLAGASIVGQSPGASYSGLLGAAALRFVQPEEGGLRLYGEAGVHAAALQVEFSRTYTDTAGDHTVNGNGMGGLGAVYARGGVALNPDESNEIVLSATLEQSFLGFSNYRETVSGSNLFAADLSGQTQGSTTAKVGVDWTTALTTDVSLTASLGAGSTIANGGASANIFGGGAAVGTAQSAMFGEYGLRVGWEPAAGARVDGFIQGSSGVGIGTHTQIGAAYHQSF